jgi:transcriptional regulator with XRE-family HTH domain
MNFYRRIGGRLRALRVQAGLSQAELGARLGLTAGAINRYESGGRRVPLSEVPRIAAVLGVPPGALLEVPAAGPGSASAEAVRELAPAYRARRGGGRAAVPTYARSLSPGRLRTLARHAGLPDSSAADSLRRYAALIADDFARYTATGPGARVRAGRRPRARRG